MGNELLSRFIFKKGDFAATKNLVKPDAFLPSRAGETSVFRIRELDEVAIWRVGQSVADVSKRDLKARADVLAEVVTKTGLRINPDNEPERHCVVVGWSPHKDAQLMQAVELANAASLTLIPTLSP